MQLKLVTKHYRKQDGLAAFELPEDAEGFDAGDHVLVQSTDEAEPDTLVVIRSGSTYELTHWANRDKLVGPVVGRLRKF